MEGRPLNYKILLSRLFGLSGLFGPGEIAGNWASLGINLSGLSFLSH